MSKKLTTLTAKDGRSFTAEVVTQTSGYGSGRDEPGEVLICTREEAFCLAYGSDVDEALGRFEENKRIGRNEADLILSTDDVNFYLVGDDVEGAAERVRAARSLVDLRDALNELREACSEETAYDRRHADEQVDMHALPTFGREPKDTPEIWSWNDGFFLVQDHDGAFELRERNDLDEPVA